MEVKRKHSPKQKRYDRILLRNVTKCLIASFLIADGKKRSVSEGLVIKPVHSDNLFSIC